MDNSFCRLLYLWFVKWNLRLTYSGKWFLGEYQITNPDLEEFFNICGKA